LVRSFELGKKDRISKSLRGSRKFTRGKGFGNQEGLGKKQREKEGFNSKQPRAGTLYVQKALQSQKRKRD